MISSFSPNRPGAFSLFLTAIAILAVFAASAMPAARASDDRVTMKQLPDRVRIEIGGRLFTEYLFFSGSRPCLYPVLDADGTGYTRDWPLSDNPKEVHDHNWHRSVWFGHGLVNGYDLWRELPGGKTGKIEHVAVDHVSDGAEGVLTVRHRWVAGDGKVLADDCTTLRVRRVKEGTFVDHEITIRASHGPLVLGDTEEGMLAVRMHEELRVSLGKGAEKRPGTGRILNANGDRDNAAWGKRAPWCDYTGRLTDGRVRGVAIFDHPGNPSHPTWWHVRDYGLFAANPLGKHNFERLKNQPDAGAITIPAGKELVFRHRIFFHHGDEREAGLEAHYRNYAGANSQPALSFVTPRTSR